MIVLNTDRAVKDLLDKRSGIYSSRPEMHVGQLVSGGLRMVLMVSNRISASICYHTRHGVRYSS